VGWNPPYTWSSTSTLPPGLKLSATDQITGSPTQAGTFTFTVKATDSEQPAAVSNTEQVTITIAPRRLTITTNALPSGKVGVAYSHPLVAAMGLAPLKWRIVTGQLPPGLTLASRTGVISGTPTTLGASSSPSESPTAAG
jgi:large repetitive protein